MRHKKFIMGLVLVVTLEGVIIFNYLVMYMFPPNPSSIQSPAPLPTPSGCQAYNTSNLVDMPKECRPYYQK